ncbi:MAG: methyltransferase domain-containing protein [Myxococcales bacterium]|nr:methyltransferase domain-containing protein [Myxococcales bacterium]
MLPSRIVQPPSPFAHGSRSRLTPRDLPRFPSESLFDKIARVVCRAECLPRKELYEAWEVARRARRRFRGGRVIDLACGHGLVAHLMLLLDDTSPCALAVDTRVAGSAPSIAAGLVGAWPRIAGRVTIEERAIAEVALTPGDLVVSVHACGALTDEVLDAALAVRARVAVLPCCQEARPSALAGWLDPTLAIDVARAHRLLAADYDVFTQTIAREITPKNRLLLGAPRTS